MSQNSEKLFMSNYQQLSAAANLLADENLIWDTDLETIRKHLAAWLLDEARSAGYASIHALKLAKAITKGN
jgi:hypothetical protein